MVVLPIATFWNASVRGTPEQCHKLGHNSERELDSKIEEIQRSFVLPVVLPSKNNVSHSKESIENPCLSLVNPQQKEQRTELRFSEGPKVPNDRYPEVENEK